RTRKSSAVSSQKFRARLPLPPRRGRGCEGGNLRSGNGTRAGLAPIQEQPSMAISARPASLTQRLLPILGWLPSYRRDWFLPGILAGVAVWAVMVPEGMAYSGIVGVPAIMGLYTIIPPLIVYALLGTSRVLVVGPDTATGLISALTVG